jgi:hypothetical protein
MNSNINFNANIGAQAVAYTKAANQNVGGEPSTLSAAQSATQHKGTEMTDDSKEAREKKRTNHIKHEAEKAREDQSKRTPNSQRGFLA